MPLANSNHRLILKYTQTFTGIILVILLITSCSHEDEGRPGAPQLDSYMWAQRSYPHGNIDHEALAHARTSRLTQVPFRLAGYDEVWQSEGPTNVEGRITDIEIPGESRRIVYAGSASGGLWRSDDTGVNWRPLFDDQPTLAIGDFDISDSSPEILYVGTGEANGGGGSLAYDGQGVYKSTDGGRTWNSVGLSNVGSIGRLMIHPTDPDIVYVAAMGRLFDTGPHRGVYKTTDGGATWEKVLYVNDRTGVIDLVFHPENPEVILAAAWQRTRTPNRLIYGGSASNIYRSTDGGDTWDIITGALPSSAADKGRIALAVAPSDPTRFYALYARSDGSLGSYLESYDSGNTWDEFSTAGIVDVPFMWWFGKLEVDPLDPDLVYYLGFESYERLSTAGGWNRIFSGVHVDQHAMAIHPTVNSLIYLGNDGGMHTSNNRGRGYTKSQRMPNIQFYTCEIDPHNSERFYGGSQDNGTLTTPTGAEDDWIQISGGDGMTVRVDPLNPNIVYTMSQNGFIQRSLDGGNNFTSIRAGLGGVFNWNSPLELSPHNSADLFLGGDVLYRSNLGEFWSVISPPMSNGPYAGNRTFGTITTIDISPINDRLILTGTDDGNVWISLDDGSTWDEISRDLPERWVTAVVADPLDAEQIYVSYSGYRFGEDVGHIFRSVSYGTEWEDITYDLPEVPVNDLIVHPTRGELYAATDIGVYYLLPESQEWRLLGIGMPVVPVTDMDFDVEEDLLLAATYGRSMYSYRFDFSTSQRDLAKPEALIVYPVPARGGEKLTIEAPETITSLELVSLTGSVTTLPCDGTLSSAQIQLPAMPTGNYVIRCLTAGGWLSEMITIE